MDFATNQKFFDPKHNKKVKLLMCIGTPLTLIGAFMLAAGSLRGLGLWFFMRICWFPLIAGVPLLAVAFSLRVKESDMLDIIDDRKREFREYCEEKLDYPGDLAANAILLSGCEEAPDAESPSRKLKSGVILTPVVTLSYLYIRRDRLTVFTRRFSLCEEMEETKTADVALDDIDQAGVVTLSESPKAFAFRLTKDGETVYSAPLFADDYTEEQFGESILHAKTRRR